MYLLLLVFGGLLSACGVVLSASGLSLRDATFDAALLTPGIIATTGGVLLIGLGGGLRTLQRIERALTLRPLVSARPTAESAKPLENETQRESVRIPLPKVVTPDSQPAVASGDIFGAKSPETASVADKIAPPVIAIAAAREGNAETRVQPFAKNGNGAGGMRGLRLPARLRPAGAGERQGEPALDAMWPKGSRPVHAAEPASVPTVHGAGATATQLQYAAAASNLPVANPESAAAALSVLKSGVVNGMPYTLYSDGSIEAQVSEGTLRFGSITELRNHIEQSA